MHSDSSKVELRHGSKSFDFAAQLLPFSEKEKLSILYSFCRLVDDIADKHSDEHFALSTLRRIESSIATTDSDIAEVAKMLTMAQEINIDFRYLHDLIDGMITDIQAVRITTDSELLKYCYCVAGTVGAMCSTVLGVEDSSALPFAIDLGIAMQLTNIARDVVEDFASDRIYLPLNRVDYTTISLALKNDCMARTKVFETVRDLLALAHKYYRSADSGMRFIPLKSRWGVLCASKCYESIGNKILAIGPSYLDARTVTDLKTKSFAAISAFNQIYVRSTFAKEENSKHNYCLHSSFHEVNVGTVR